MERLSPQQQRLFACDCAEHVLFYFEQFQPLDKRPRIAIETARQYALGKVSREELEKARGDAESAAYEAGDAAWRAVVHQPQDEAAASAAATAEGCSLTKLDIEGSVNTAIEVVVIAAVGTSAADTVWLKGDSWTTLPPPVLQRYRDAETQERAWQLKQAQRYASTNSEP